MSKKDYQAIAAALYTNRTEHPGLAPAKTTGRSDWGRGAELGKHAAWWRIVQAMADVLAADNPRFSRERFIEACETGRCKGMRQVA